MPRRILTVIAAALVIYGGIFYQLTQVDDDDPWYDQ
jgi:hypothetical protein